MSKENSRPVLGEFELMTRAELERDRYSPRSEVEKSEMPEALAVQGAPNPQISGVRALGAVSNAYHLQENDYDIEAILMPEGEIKLNNELLEEAADDLRIDILAAEDYSEREVFETAFDDVEAMLNYSEENGLGTVAHHTSDAHARAVSSAYSSADTDVEAYIYGHGRDGFSQQLKQRLKSVLQRFPEGRDLARRF